MLRKETLLAIENWLAPVAVIVLLAGVVFCANFDCFPSKSERSIRDIITAIELRHPDGLSLAREYLKRYSATPFAIALAAEAAAISFEHEAAIEYFRQLPADGGRWEFLKHLGIARRCEILGKLADEETHLRHALKLNPTHLEANERLGNLLQFSGRTWESAPHFYIQMRRGKCRGDELLGMSTTERLFRADEHMQLRGLSADPPEYLSQLAVARRILIENQQSDAETLLRGIIDAAPHLGEAQGRLGRLIYDRGDPIEFLQWRGSLSEDARKHPEVWFVQGLQARRLGQPEGAVRCFLEALTLSPNHLGANLQLAGCLEQLGRSEIAQEFVRRGELLETVESTLNILKGDVDAAHIHKVVHSFERLGRFWEAAGWTNVMLSLEIPRDGITGELKRLLRLAVQDDVSNSAEFRPASKLQRSDFPEPRWQAPRGANDRDVRASDEEAVRWKFRNEADVAGIRFQYFEGTTEATRLQHIFNVVGGGMAAFDYDQDGWCDLHLAQANNWRDPSIQLDYPDRLFRNLEGRQFEDVTQFAGVGELGFSHGVAAEDFDQDGFSDLYIGNLGANRLYHNNGDGTFRDATMTAGVAGNEWTTSSTFADFNGDGLPDLYAANYSVLEETVKKECHRSSGDPVACSPDVLTAEYHRFYLNAGDGSFRDVTVESGMHIPHGRGLGLVAWDFEGHGRLGLFVANDTCPNFLFINMGNNGQGIPQFREEGVVRGVAFDVDGNAKASMGVAAGDSNGDARIDLFISTFFGESNTFYSQREDGAFDELTRPFGLRDASFWMLGFGCQFGDFDGDGWDDLVVTNGHVDQFSRRGDPDRMRPQLFRNLHGQKFVEIPSARIGPFFEQKYLGRGLATLDWNRDGRVDFGVSHIHGDFSLVSNYTESKQRPLVIKLVGRSGSRLPVGAITRIKIRGRNVFRCVTGGDGYLVTNEHRLAFWIPDEQSESEIEIRWPGGAVEHWANIRSGQELLLIEGKPNPTVLQTFN